MHARYGTVVELFYAHGLRQSQRTLSSTGFAIHQDTEDYAFIEYTVVVKLTPDARDITRQKPLRHIIHQSALCPPPSHPGDPA